MVNGTIRLIIHSQILSCYSFPVSYITFSCRTHSSTLKWNVAGCLETLSPISESQKAFKLNASQIATSMMGLSGFGGLEVVCWPLVPKFAGSHPAEAVGFLG